MNSLSSPDRNNINLAISLNANVIAVNTNHINKSPINSKFSKAGNLLVSNPW